MPSHTKELGLLDGGIPADEPAVAIALGRFCRRNSAIAGWRARRRIYTEPQKEVVMLRSVSVVLAVGLVLLWLVGLNQHATAWLTWLDGLAALCAFGLAIGAGPAVTRAIGAGGPIALGIGIGILWIIGLAMHTEPWLTWWTFAFACAFVVLGVAGGMNRRELTPTRPRTV
jgi:hypothetical protein